MKPSHELLSAWRRTRDADPGAPAVIDAATGRGWSRADLAQAADDERRQLPSGLDRRRILLIEPNGPRWFARFLALLELDAIPVPLDPTETAERQAEIGRDIRAAGIWAGADYQPLTEAQPEPDRAACLVKLTSGSTGRPQPLRFTAAQMLADGRQVCASMGITGADRNLAIIPCGHSYGLGNLVMPLLAQGTALVVPASPLPRVLAETCARWQCTVFPAVPTLLRLLAEGDPSPDLLASLRLIITAGSSLPPAVARAFASRYGRRLHNFYGSSETGGICFDRDGEATLTGRSVGQPLDGVTLTPTAAGRFWVESAAVMTLGRPRRSPFGRHRPADRGELTPDGELVLLGRAGRIVKIGGRRIELGEIETAFRRVPGVTEAFAAPHPSLADELAAVVQTSLGERELRVLLATQWPAWKIPRRLVCLSSLPTTGRGKMDTPALRRLLEERAGAGTSARPTPSADRAVPADPPAAGGNG